MPENTLNATKPVETATPATKTLAPVQAAPAVEAKKETKKAGKETKRASTATAATTKPAKKKGIKAVWVKKEKVQKDAKVKATSETLKENWKPVFWGRFGKKNMRTRTNPKFDKWRKPRGEDMLLRKDDGMYVQVGYRTPKAIRGLHPSGYEEVMIYSKKDLDTLNARAQAARFAGTIGRKKRITLTQYANTKKIHVLN